MLQEAINRAPLRKSRCQRHWSDAVSESDACPKMSQQVEPKRVELMPPQTNRKIGRTVHFSVASFFKHVVFIAFFADSIGSALSAKSKCGKETGFLVNDPALFFYFCSQSFSLPS